MTTAVIFQCDTCNREIQIPQNKRGLDTVGSCVITYNCKGHLRQIAKKENVLQIPIPVPEQTGLQDWIQRRLLYNFTQYTPQARWTIKHDLGVEPSILTFVNTDNGLIDITPASIETISPFISVVVFNQQYSGVAQCIARSTSTLTAEDFAIETPETLFRQLSTTGELTLATTLGATSIPFNITFLNPDNYTPTTIVSVNFLNPVSFLSAWRDHNFVFFHDKLFTVRSANIQDVIANNSIKDNSPFYFSKMDDNNNPIPIDENDSFILLATPPYQNVDKDPFHLIDLSLINATSDPILTYQLDGVMFYHESSIRSIYPPIKKFS